MTISEILQLVAFQRGLQRAQSNIRNGTGNGDIVITINVKNNTVASAKVSAETTTRIDAMEIRPEPR